MKNCSRKAARKFLALPPEKWNPIFKIYFTLDWFSASFFHRKECNEKSAENMKRDGIILIMQKLLHSEWNIKLSFEQKIAL